MKWKLTQNGFRTIGSLFGGVFSNDMGIDLGTANTRIFVPGQGIVLFEPSVVAIRKGTSRVLEVGEDAKRMIGRTPGNIVAIRPMRNGVIADFEVTESMLRYFIRKVQNRRFLVKPRIVIAIPSGLTPVERRAVRDAAFEAGAGGVYPVEEPRAAAIGVGLPIYEPAGNMVISIGGGTTEMAVISLGDVVTSRSIRTGGDELDGAIIEHLKKTYNLMIGERTAEEIKIQIGSAFPLEEELTMDVRGRDLSEGLPRMVTITSQEVREAVREPISLVIQAVRDTLEVTPPELSADLIERGIILVGGGALLRGIDKLLTKETGLPVRVADEPMTAIAQGTGTVLEEPRYLRYLKDEGR